MERERMSSSDSEEPIKNTTNGYPPSTGYPVPPPPPPHQGYPQPYQTYGHPYYAYPNTSDPYANYAAPPNKNQAYYHTQNYLPVQPEPNTEVSFARSMFIMMIILILATSAMSLVTWLVFGTELPDFRVESLSVPTFVITNSTLLAKWNVNMTVENPNKNIEIAFEHVESAIIYKDAFLAINTVEPFSLVGEEQGIFRAELETSKNSSKAMDGDLAQEIASDQRKGMVVFSLRLALDSTFKSGSLWRRTKLSAFCEDLSIGFPATTGVGTLLGGQTQCLIFS